MKILAVTLEKCSGCAVFIDDKIVFSSSEERYTNIKSDSSFPSNSIRGALAFCGLKGSDFDKVIICGNKISLIPSLVNEYSTFTVDDQIKAMEEYWYPKLMLGQNKSFLEIFRNKINLEQYPFNTELGKRFNIFQLHNPYTEEDGRLVSEFYKQIISSFLEIEQEKIMHMEHDWCHAAYAFYGSPIRDDNTLIVTADAWGDDLSGSISLYSKSKGQIERVKEYNHRDFQLARIYRYTTLVLRMLANEHEYKVMGLAPYYNGPVTEKVEKVFDKMLVNDGLEFTFNKEIPDIYNYLQNNLKNFRFDHIASGLQSFTEKILVNWFSSALKKYESTSVVYSGGVSMNVKANLKISKIPQIKRFFVCGAGTDETLPIGACYHWAEMNNINPKPLSTLYLGAEASYSESDIASLNQFTITKFVSEDQILEKILENKIIAICRGRMEMGQRALGNRSIIADPRTRLNVEKINHSIKMRDFWMPFAPIVLEEHQQTLLENPKNLDSPFMTIAFETKEGKNKIPAAVHQSDGTARAQLLKKEHNPILWNMIFKFYQKTGIPALLNTSLNLHGEPIVRTVQDAIRVFTKSDLEVLWLNNHIIEKKYEKN
jgi:carbamoyltransferase